MALPASDAFTTGANSTLVAYSANWTLNNGGFDVIAANDNVTSSVNDEGGAYWNADTFNANQYAQVVKAAVGTEWGGAAVRVSTAGADTWYGFYTNGSAAGTNLFKMVAGTWTQLGSNGSVAITAGQTLRIEANGTTITPYVNGAVYSSIGAQTDSSIAAGAAGICGYGAATSANRIDDFLADNLGGAPATSLPFLRHLRRMQSIYVR